MLVKDAYHNGSGENLSIIAGYDENHKISGIRLRIQVNGRKITDDMPGKPNEKPIYGCIFIGEHGKYTFEIETKQAEC